LTSPKAGDKVPPKVAQSKKVEILVEQDLCRT
jgi:hypothetical protein